MNESRPLDDLLDIDKDEPITTLDIVSSLMNRENIDLKTEIINPYALSTFVLIGTYLKTHGDKINGHLLLTWKELLNEFMVSNKRLGRKEIVEILKGYFAEERTREKQLTLSSNLAKRNNNNNDGF